MLKGSHHIQSSREKIKKARKLQVFSYETRIKMSKARKGKKLNLSKEGREKLRQNGRRVGLSQVGHKVSIETRKKISLTKLGAKSHFWKGGVSPLNELMRSSSEYRQWRIKVYERDNYTCQKYKIRGGDLVPHHILNYSNYPELRYDINNGITLSEKAHKEFHSKYGVKNNTKQQLEEFLNN